MDPLSAPPSLLRGSLTAGRTAISSDPRDRRAERCQQPRREAEQRRRATVVRCAARLHQCGVSWRQAAHEVQTPERTLRDWRAHPDRTPGRRGRPPLATSRACRSAVLHFLHHVSGAAVGLASLVALFPEVPRCILADLLRRYRRVWRRRYRRSGYRLFWHVPGRVWAIDHSRAAHCVDGVYRQIFAVRDVASHKQLAWEPVRSTGAEEIRPILWALFTQHDPPLVIKNDNGSAFRATDTRGWMLAWEALQLFSPVGYPQYNGQLERSNAVNKTYTHQHAVAEGHPQQWTRRDLDAARQLTNSISRPWGARGKTPDESWASRAPITLQERASFTEEVTRQRQEARHELGFGDSEVLEADAADEVDRRAIGRALEVRGYLTKVEQKRAPRAKRRRGRESLERALRKQRESRDTPAEQNGPPADAGDATISRQGDPSSREASHAAEQELAATNMPQGGPRDNVEAARPRTNSISRPWGARGGTPDQCWTGGGPITDQERNALEEEVSRQRQETRPELGFAENAVLEADAPDEVNHRAMGRALEVRGYSPRDEQPRAPRAKPRRRRESLEHSLGTRRESRDTPPAHESQSEGAGHTAVSPQGDPSSRQAPRATKTKFAAINLAIAPQSDKIPMVIDKCSLESNTRPPPCVAQRERPLSSWWRRPITLLISKLKAAIIPR